MTTAPQTALQPGTSGDAVRQLQQWLIEQGYNIPAGPTGFFGSQTQEALTKWQQTHNVDVAGNPGFYGPRTMAVIQRMPQQSIASQPPTAPISSPISPVQHQSGVPSQPSSPAPIQPTAPLTPTPPAPQNPPPNGSDMPIDPSMANGTPYFMGPNALVRFSGQGPTGYMNQNTVWLVDQATKTLRPFVDGTAIQNFFSGPIDPNQIHTLSASVLNPGGILGSQNGKPGFQTLSGEYAINQDGSARPVDYSSAQLATRYGKPQNEQSEMQAHMTLDGFMNLLSNSDGGLSTATLDKLKNDDTLHAFYLNALTYGGYSLPDIYRDLKARELGATDIKPVSATAVKSQYAKTPEGQRASTDTRISAPPRIGNLSLSDLDLPIFNIPDEAFKTLIPTLDYNSPEFKQKMNAVETSYYDILEKQINAGTEQEKAVADYQWQQFRDNLARSYGIKLSNNPLDAWNQIQQAYDTFSQRGIQGSGLQNEAIDSYLKRVRQSDQNSRDEMTSRADAQKLAYYTGFATSQQIHSLDPGVARSYGLIPSDEVLKALSVESLRQKYPDMSDEEIQRYRMSILDDNGDGNPRYRSNLFQKQIEGVMAQEAAKRQYQTGTVLDQSLRDEQKAYKEFTTPDVPFLRATDTSRADVQPYVPATTPSTISLLSQIKAALPTSPAASTPPSGSVGTPYYDTSGYYHTPGANNAPMSTPPPSGTPSQKTPSSAIPPYVAAPKPSAPALPSPVKTSSPTPLSKYNMFGPTNDKLFSTGADNQSSSLLSGTRGSGTVGPSLGSTQGSSGLWGKIKSWF